jgi:hypothetical protein
MNELPYNTELDCRSFVYKQLKMYIGRLRDRRQSDDWFDWSTENQYLMSKIKELWYWRDRLNKSA